MSTREELVARIKGFVMESSLKNDGDIEVDTMIFKENVLDSMGLVTLISYLEEELDIITEDTDLVEENFETLNAIADYVERKKG